jgi:hypothetical protein
VARKARRDAALSRRLSGTNSVLDLVTGGKRSVERQT